MAGLFDDLPDAKPAARGPFDDLPDAGQPIRRKVGAFESFDRSAATEYAKTGKVLGLAASAPALAIDSIVEALTGNNPRFADKAFGYLVDPAQRAVEYWQQKPDEEFNPAAAAGGSVSAIIPQVIGQPGRAIVPATERLLPRIIPQAAEGGIKAQIPMAVPGAADTYSRASDAGATPEQAAGAALSDWEFLTAAGMLPAAAPGGIATRAATGAGINVASSVPQEMARNEILSGVPSMQTDPFDVTNLTTQGGLGALFGIAFGGRGRAPRRAPVQAPPPPPDPGAIVQANTIDPNEPIGEFIARTLIGQQATPKDLSERRRDAGSALRANPEDPTIYRRESMDPVTGQMTPATERGTGTIATDPDRLANQRIGQSEVESGRSAEAIEIARRQAQRKQDAVDYEALDGRPRNQSDASAGGTTSPEGTAALEPETFRFLDVVRDKSGRVISTGPQVDIITEGLTIKRGNKDVAAVEVRYSDADGTEYTAVVPAERIGELSRPRNPRFAQDNAAQSYSPPRGVGTGEQQPTPRNAAQRITTEESRYSFEPAEPEGGRLARAAEDIPGQATEIPDLPRLQDRRPRPPAGTRQIEVDPEREIGPNAFGDNQPRAADDPARRPFRGPEPIIGERPASPDLLDETGQRLLREREELRLLREVPPAQRTAGQRLRLRELEGAESRRTPRVEVPPEPAARNAGNERPIEVVESRARRETVRQPEPVQKRPYRGEPPIIGEPPAREAAGPLVDPQGRIAADEAERASIEAVPPAQRTAEQRIRLRALQRGPAPDIAAPSRQSQGAPRQQPLEIVRSRGPQSVDRTAPEQPVRQATPELTPQQIRKLENTQVEVTVREAETGAEYRVQMSAREALAKADERLRTLKSLRECLDA